MGAGNAPAGRWRSGAGLQGDLTPLGRVPLFLHTMHKEEARRAARRPDRTWTMAQAVPRPLLYAHRGACRVEPENTMAAFSRAVEEGAHGVETDLRLTRDGTVVLLHDDSLERTTGLQGPVSDISWPELRHRSRVPVATLEELWHFAVERGVFLDLEIKETEEAAVQHIVAQVSRLQREQPLSTPLLVTSFHPQVLAQVWRGLPGVWLGLLFVGEPPAVSVPVDFWLPRWEPGRVWQGAKLIPWDCNDARCLREAVQGNWSGLITDVPGEMAAAFLRGGAES